MNISKHSWHYKLNNFFDSWMDHKDFNLCKYFWTTVAHCIVIGVVITVIGLFIYGLITTILSPGGLFLLLGLFCCLLMPVLPTITIKTLRKHNKAPQDPEIVSLFSAWLYAQKTKVCPYITFID